MAQLSLAWLLQKEQVTTLLTEASNSSQIESNTAATEITVPKDLRKLGQLVLKKFTANFLIHRS